MEDTHTEQNKAGWFGDLNLRHLMMIAVISLFAGGGGGAGIVASKGVQATSGISEEKADVKYLSKSDADRRVEARDKQVERLDKENLKTVVFEAYHSNDEKRLDRIEKNIERILENQSRR
jgi:hypothetical protein